MGTQLAEFHRFSSLCSEIRRNIWKYSLPDRRVVELCFRKENPEVIRGYAAEPQVL